MRPAFEVADVLRAHWPEIEKHRKINSWQLRHLSALKSCRTAELGGHIDACTSCGVVRQSYNSCRNRHCPKCQGKEREAWIGKRTDELLPVPYFHVVFTLPDTINPLAMHQPKDVYDALFEAAWGTINTFAKDEKHLGAQAGMISILHTWGQQLTLHPHLHCIVPGGGLTYTPRKKKGGTNATNDSERSQEVRHWKVARSKGKYLFPVKAMSKVFRAKYVDALKKRIPNLDKTLVNDLYKKAWVVYAKRPFGNAHSVLEYLGRYTHKIAISNHRIKNVDVNGVTISYKDYRDGAQNKELTLEPMEFVRRFSMHILPYQFVRIRHYGILSSTSKKKNLPIIRQQTGQTLQLVNTVPMVNQSLGVNDAPKVNNEPTVKNAPQVAINCNPQRVTTGYNPLLCPHCNTETMVTIETFNPRGPPKKSAPQMFNAMSQSSFNKVVNSCAA
jgi:Putative transposase/Transposase zinc-binding domain